VLKYNLTSLLILLFSDFTATYSYTTTNKMHLLSQIIYSCKTLYMFQTVFPSIIFPSTCCYSSSCLTYTTAVYAVLSSWWWTERPSETCRAIYKNK